MRNIAIMLAILLGAHAAAVVLGASAALAGRVSIASVFLFTAIGHFARPAEMLEMIPLLIRCGKALVHLTCRKALIYISGAFEVALGVGLIAPQACRIAALIAIAFLVLITPLNVYSALKRVDFGGHAAGPRYLLVRVPLQVLLIAWIWWFVLRGR